MAKNENQLNDPQIALITTTQVTLPSPLKARARPDVSRSPVGVALIPDEQSKTRAQNSPVGFDFLTGTNDGTLPRISRGEGAIATGAPVQLIFWGSIWNNGALPSTSEIISAVQNILAGPFMSGLLQYGVNRSPFRGAIVVTSPEPPFGVNTFDLGDIEELIGALIENGTFPEPDEDGGRNIYVVVMPPATNFDGPSNVGGQHSHFSSGSITDVDNVWYAWIGNGTIDMMTHTFGHELAETCTDPEGDGWTLDGAPAGFNEIGDPCNNSTNLVNGVSLEAYWSQLDNACLLPTEYSLKRFMLSSGLDPTKGLRPVMLPPSPLPQFFSLRALMKI
jgi:hypothetical protein